mmetsp:Transcript_78882/g.229099  ORF Transcript_78882/g.229099 Transcript_78882/m.229099 type:complete len:301 (+) Transcript_78882:151-1053(+)
MQNCSARATAALNAVRATPRVDAAEPAAGTLGRRPASRQQRRKQRHRRKAPGRRALGPVRDGGGGCGGLVGLVGLGLDNSRCGVVEKGLLEGGEGEAHDVPLAAGGVQVHGAIPGHTVDKHHCRQVHVQVEPPGARPEFSSLRAAMAPAAASAAHAAAQPLAHALAQALASAAAVALTHAAALPLAHAAATALAHAAALPLADAAAIVVEAGAVAVPCAPAGPPAGAHAAAANLPVAEAARRQIALDPDGQVHLEAVPIAAEGPSDALDVEFHVPPRDVHCVVAVFDGRCGRKDIGFDGD